VGVVKWGGLRGGVNILTEFARFNILI
jgi:hypothetical protein